MDISTRYAMPSAFSVSQWPCPHALWRRRGETGALYMYLTATGSYRIHTCFPNQVLMIVSQIIIVNKLAITEKEVYNDADID